MAKTKDYKCAYCTKITTSSTSLRLHVAQKHHCYTCNKLFHDPSRNSHVCMKQTGRGLHTVRLHPTTFILNEEALDGTFQSYTIVSKEKLKSIETVFKIYKNDFVGLLTNVLLQSKTVKVRIVLNVMMHNNITGDEMEHYLSSKPQILMNATQINSLIYKAIISTVSNLNIFVLNGSSWSLIAVEEIAVKISKYRPFRVGHRIELPSCYSGKHGLINIKSTSNTCFAYCCIAKYLGFKTKEEGEVIKTYLNFMNVSNYDHEKKKFTLIDFSMLDLERGVELEDINKFLKHPLNKDFSINIFIHCEEINGIYPYSITLFEKKLHMDLLMIHDSDHDTAHFVLIHDFNLFMKIPNNHTRYFCKRCLQSFASLSKLASHGEYCSKHPPRRIEFPENPFIKYTLGENSMPQPAFVVGDFESYLRDLKSHYNKKKGIKGKHIPLSFCYAYVVGKSVEFQQYWDKAEPDVVFVKAMLNLAVGHLERLSAYKHVMKLSNSDWFDFITATRCGICKEPLRSPDKREEIDMNEFFNVEVVNDEDDDCPSYNPQLTYQPNKKYSKYQKVRHHYHGSVGVGGESCNVYTPQKFIAACHSSCNLQLKSRRELTVVFHNLQFDGSFIISGLSKLGYKNIKVLAKSSERFLSIQVPGLIIFKDSLLHLPFSLSKLISILKKDKSQFSCTRQMLPGLTEKQYDLMISKQAMCYDYINPTTFDEPRDSLPDHKEFFSLLANKNVSVDEYKVANSIYKAYSCKSLRDWVKLYCKLDVGCLIDVLICHRDNCQRMFGLDPLNFLSLSAASFNAAFSSSNATIERVTDPDLYLAVKESMRGGIVGCPTRLELGNYKDLPSYTPNKPEKAIAQLDLNSMYVGILRKKLATGNYKLLNSDQVSNFNIMDIDEDGPKGYLICCDISLKASLHRWFSDAPMLPERIKIPSSSASQYQKDMRIKFPELASSFDKTQYLLTLFPKTKYVDHVHALKCAVKWGYEITKYHYIYEYDQAAILEEWMTKNLNARAMTESEIESLILKLFGNSVYGRCALNKLKFRDFHLVQDHVTAERLVKKPNFKSFSVINNNLVMIEMKKTKVMMDNNLIIASQVLSRARALFFDTFYQIKKQLQDKAFSILYYDTDGAVVSWETDDYLRDLSNLKVNDSHVMDWSNFPKTSNYYCTKYKGVPTKLKLETGHKRITRFCALKKKMYALELEDGGCKKRAKGGPEKVLDDVTFQTYLDILTKCETKTIRIHALQSLKLQIYHIEQQRMLFNSICDSRFLLKNHRSYPFGFAGLEEGEHDSVFEEC